MLVGVCVRVKNEDVILNEFILHYINIGFDKIHIYDNNSLIPVEELCKNIIKTFPDIISVEKDKSNPKDPNWGQTMRYNEFLNKNRHLSWILNCDADEFLYLHTHKNIKDFLSEFSDDTSVIHVNWVTFGTSKLLNLDKNKLVMEQLVLREEYKTFWNYFKKSFIRPNLISEIKNFHNHDSENYLTKNVYNDIIVKTSESTFNDLVIERDKLRDDTPLVMIHYMTLDFANMQIKHNKNKGTLMTLEDDKYTIEWYNKNFMDNVLDNRMNKYSINHTKLFLYGL